MTKKPYGVKLSQDTLRIKLLQLGFAVPFVVILLRLVQIQILDSENYRAMAYDQYSASLNIIAPRGNILSHDNHVLAGTVTRYLLYGEPYTISNKEQTSMLLGEIISETFQASPAKSKYYYYEKFISDLNRDPKLMWVPLAHGLDPVTKNKIQSQQISGVGFEEEPSRLYPESSLAAHLLGFVASNEHGEKTGYYGVEGYLNEELKGRPGRVLEERDAVGEPLLSGKYRKISAIPGSDVYPTIRTPIQYVIEKKLKEGVEKYNASSGTVIVMDPFTGEILGLANYPSFEPDNLNFNVEYVDAENHRKVSEFRNHAISDTYEPGSVIKPLTIATALDLGLITPSTTYEDSGPVNYSGFTINNWDYKHYGTMTIVQLLQKSNNIGAAWVGHKVGAQNLYTYFSRFGIGKKTGVALEGEDTGVLHEPTRWTDIDLATISFGQGVSATPLQVLNSFNVLANGGKLMQPLIISKIVTPSKEMIFSPKELQRVISPQTSDTMVDLLEKAVEGGEAKYFVLKEYSISGKTGTAQIPENGKYSPGKTNATFVGFLSKSKRYSMIVLLQQPKSSVYAAETSVPLWLDITSELTKLLGIPADKTPESVINN